VDATLRTVSLWTTPLPRSSLGAQHHALRVEQARVLAKVILENCDAPPRMHRPSLVADPVSLRGIPAVGRGVSGAVRGSRPGDGIR
jgi:hypothetical protein